ncbi:hypothetical protein E4U24_000122 [Claviceps purpurea]|nr:hypothetical protein E4U36_002670 [Claviceps purpurea]KAG6252922.1 hypothetical protein E4U24_000122 [Claviceps purpurea]KAG6285703.1 hypothetical protein E4U46_005539 [Claviceps purpurea]KAG6302223.1 hypothetical protein E4U45_002923 [Claviceps purpurea]KAG6312594.1 hypothetical protein E4U44_003192 [Claviceps purpurea]
MDERRSRGGTRRGAVQIKLYEHQLAATIGIWMTEMELPIEAQNPGAQTGSGLEVVAKDGR